MSDQFNEFQQSDEFEDDNDFSGSNDQDGYSFESILADVKSSAFINGDKKTPPDLLQEKADRILREAAQMSAAAAAASEIANATAAANATAETTANIQRAPEPNQIPQATTAEQQVYQTQQEQYEPYMLQSDFEPEFSDTDDIPMIVIPLEGEVNQQKPEPQFASFGFEMNPDGSPVVEIPVNNLQPDSNVKQDTIPFYDQLNDDSFSDDNQDTKIHTLTEEPTLKTKWGFGKRNQSEMYNPADSPGLFDDEDSEYTVFEDEVFAEPQLRSAVRVYANLCNSISLRVIPASVITILMILITYVFEAGMMVPFGIGYSLEHAAGTLVLCLLFVMMLCSDIIVRGVDFLIKGVPNAETLVLFSCLFSLISAAFTIISGAAMMLPFCAVSALSLVFAAHGEKYNLRAITDTLKTAVGSSEPYGVQAEYNLEIDKSVLKKSFNRIDGFYNNLMQPDITEVSYRYAAPVLLVGALLLTVLIILIRGGVENSLHILSALLAAAAPFSVLLSFSVPFATVAKSAKKSGAAVAGWGGADDIYFTDGVCVTDDDLFPPGMLKLSGVKVYDGAPPENAIRYTASLILSSGSGLTNLFAEVLKQQGLSSLKVDNFECHESGIAAEIKGEQISTGSAAFMNLLGVRVPDDTNMKNAVYTAVNNRLVAMFAIDYKPLPSVQSALISMLKWRIDLFFAMRDFNVTPAMVGQKFKVPFDSFVFIPAKNSYSLSDLYSDKPGRMVAILVREGLNPYAEAITGGRLLKSAALFATILSIVSAALGVLIMFYMCWTGSFISASPGNLVIFMLCMLATVLIVCGYVKLKK